MGRALVAGMAPFSCGCSCSRAATRRRHQSDLVERSRAKVFERLLSLEPGESQLDLSKLNLRSLPDVGDMAATGEATIESVCFAFNTIDPNDTSLFRFISAFPALKSLECAGGIERPPPILAAPPVCTWAP